MNPIRELLFDLDPEPGFEDEHEQLHTFLVEYAMAAYTLGLPARLENVVDDELGLQVRFMLFSDAPEEFHSRWSAPEGARLDECVVAEREEAATLLEQLSEDRWLTTLTRAHWINIPTFADQGEVGGWTRAWVIEYYDLDVPEIHGS